MDRDNELFIARALKIVGWDSVRKWEPWDLRGKADNWDKFSAALIVVQAPFPKEHVCPGR